MLRKMIGTALLGTVLLQSGCGTSTQAPAPNGGGTNPNGGTVAKKDALPAGLMLTTAPEGALEIVAAKKTVKVGDEVVIRGKIGGAMKPFTEDRATMMLMDLSLLSCDLGPQMPKCPTPWDYCCEENTTLQKQSAFIQIVGADEKTLKTTLEGSLGKLDVVVVKGKVTKNDEHGFQLNATGIFVQEKFKK